MISGCASWKCWEVEVPFKPKFNPHIGNIFTVYSMADHWDREEGMHAYRTYHAIMWEIARESGKDMTMEKVAGAFAALSPNADYITNLESTRRAVYAYNTWGVEGKDKFQVTSYPANKTKAWRILCGEAPLDVLGGLKTRSFYMNIMYPENTVEVTIDAHMLSVWSLRRFKVQEANMSPARYLEVARDFVRVAFLLDIFPSQLQAICWFTWKRVNRISFPIDKLQPGLFQQNIVPED